MSSWHVWAVTANRHRRIMEFLSELKSTEPKVIEDFIYPMAEKEYKTKKGTRIKEIPIYSNYIFIKYNNNIVTDDSIEKCNWISSYVGKCSDDEILRVQEQNRCDYADMTPTTHLCKGDVVKLIQTPFIGWVATIVDIDGDKLSVSIEILGSERIIKCNVSDVHIM